MLSDVNMVSGRECTFHLLLPETVEQRNSKSQVLKIRIDQHFSIGYYYLGMKISRTCRTVVPDHTNLVSYSIGGRLCRLMIGRLSSQVCQHLPIPTASPARLTDNALSVTDARVPSFLETETARRHDASHL